MEVETIEERKKRLKREYQRNYRQRQKEICGASNDTLQKRQKRKIDQIGETEEDSIERRAMIAQQVKRSRRAQAQIMNVNEHYCGTMTFICKHCRSLNFESENTTPGIFSHCCHNGTMTIPEQLRCPQDYDVIKIATVSIFEIRTDF